MIYIILILLNIFVLANSIFVTPEKAINQFIYNLRNGFFQDIYEEVTDDIKSETDRDNFHRTGQKFMHDGEIETVYIDRSDTVFDKFDSPQIIPLTITYITRELGSFEEKINLKIVKENGAWKIPWKWSYLINSLEKTDNLQLEVEFARRGSLLASDKSALAKEVSGSMIWITPEHVDADREKDLLEELYIIFDGKYPVTNLHHRYAFNTQPDWPVTIGVVTKSTGSDEIQDLLNFSGVSVTFHPARWKGKSDFIKIGDVGNSRFFECCSLLYSTTNYDGLSGAEQEKNIILKGTNGGILVMFDKEGKEKRVLIEAEKVDGEDAQP